MLTVGPVRDPAEAAAARLGHAPATLRRRATASTTRRRRRSPASAAGGCSFGGQPAHNEVISRPDSNDTRMQQVMYANGKLWGALDTALNPDGGAAAGRHRLVHRQPERRARSSSQGYLGAAGYDFTYPAIGVTASGRGVMAFTATGDTLNPSAAYAPIDAIVGVGAWNVVPGGAGRRAGRRLHELQGAGRQPAAHALGRLRRGRRRRQLDLDRQRVHRPRLRLHRRGAARSSWAAPATTCSAPALARATGPARGRRSATGRRGSAS